MILDFVDTITEWFEPVKQFIIENNSSIVFIVGILIIGILVTRTIFGRN